MSRMVIVMAVILALKSRASTATGEAIASQAPLSTVQTTRLIKGRLMKPASSAREATARPEASVSLPRGSLVEEPTLSRLFTPPARSACLPAVSFHRPPHHRKLRHNPRPALEQRSKPSTQPKVSVGPAYDR